MTPEGARGECFVDADWSSVCRLSAALGLAPGLSEASAKRFFFGTRFRPAWKGIGDCLALTVVSRAGPSCRAPGLWRDGKESMVDYQGKVKKGGRN